MPKKVDHTKRREGIAKAAFAVIARDGIAGATLRAVADEANTSSALLMHYIKSKDELLLEAHSYVVDMVLDRMVAAEKRYTGVEALRRVLWEALPLDKKSEDIFKVWLGFWEMSAQSAPVRLLLNRLYRESNARFARIIRHAQELGEVPKTIDVEMTAWEATILVDGIGAHIVGGGQKFSVAEKKRLVDHWIERMMAPQKPRAR